MADDADAIRALNDASGVGTRHTVLHYLYFPRQQDAQLVARAVREQGFRSESRLGADGENWLVLRGTS